MRFSGEIDLGSSLVVLLRSLYSLKLVRKEALISSHLIKDPAEDQE